MLRALVIAIAGLLAAGLVLVVYVGSQAGPVAPPPRAMVAVIATVHSVRAGSLLQPGDLSTLEVPADAVPPGAHPDTPDARGSLVGAMVRRMLEEHEVIAGDDVLRPGERGFLAAVLKPGTRAVSVAVDAVTGAAGLIWPGDRVDLILTQTIDGSDQSPSRRVAGELVLGDAQVIAVDQQMVQGGQANGLLDNHTQTSRTITLEVTPRDAARVAVATRLGRLQAVLRAAQAVASTVDPLTPPVTLPSTPSVPVRSSTVAASAAEPIWGGDVSSALAPAGGPRSPEIRLFQGTKPVEVYKF
jgi:pilus assembly protein CpaB